MGHTSAVINNNVFIVFGGYGGPEGHTKFDEINLLHLDTMTWSQPEVTGTMPPGVYAHSSFSMGDKLIVYGGDIGSTTRKLSSDLYIFELSSLKWTKVNTLGQIPPPRSHFGSALVENKFFIFGGSGPGEQEKLNDMYYLDLSTIDMFRYIPFKHMNREVNDFIDDIIHQVEDIYDVKIGQGAAIEKESTKRSNTKVLETIANSMEEMRSQVDKLTSEKVLFKQWKEEQKELLATTRKGNEIDMLSNELWTKSGRITLNIGGHRFETTVSTLYKDTNSLLSKMFSGKYELTQDSDGSYFIDRDGSCFRYILNYLRNLAVYIPPNRMLHLKLLREATYYQLDGLVEHIKTGLKKLEQELDPNNEAAEEARRKGKSKI